MTKLSIYHEKEILGIKLYKSFQNALSDALDECSDVQAIIHDAGFEVITHKPDFITFCSESNTTGYGDDLKIAYPNKVSIMLEDVFFEDEKEK